MTRIETTAGRRIESAKATEILKDIHLLLEEVETLLEEELIAVHFMKMADQGADAAEIMKALKNAADQGQISADVVQAIEAAMNGWDGKQQAEQNTQQE
jgi:hypothetical protein